MDKNLFEKDNFTKKIEVPKDLENIMITSIKKGEKKLRKKNLINTSKILVAGLLLIIISLNIFPGFSAFATNLPIIGKIAEIMTFDKGIKNAVEEGLYQYIGYSERKNGINLKVKNVAGDYRSLYVEYEIEGMGDNRIEIKLKSKENAEDIEYSVGYSPYYFGEEEVKSSANFKFQKFVGNFTLLFSIKENSKEEDIITEFEIEINLDEKFNKEVNEIGTGDKNIKTDIGEIKIKNLDSSTTRTSLEFEFLSEEYDFMSFDNAKLVDEKGEEYKTSNFYSPMKNGNLNIEFEGDLSKKQELTFKSEGIYFARKDNRVLTLDLENLKLEENDYNIRLLNKEEIKQNSLESEENENIIVLASKETMGFDLKESDKVSHINTSMHTIERTEDNYVEFKMKSETLVRLELLTSDKIINLEIESIYRDRTGALEFKIK